MTARHSRLDLSVLVAEEKQQKHPAVREEAPEKLVVSLKTLSQMLDAGRSSVRRWLSEAGIKPIAIGRGVKGAIRYRWDEVKAWLESREHVD